MQHYAPSSATTSSRPAGSVLASLLLAGTVLAGSLFAAPAQAETPEEKGLAIAKESDRRDLGWDNSRVSMKMILKNAHGQSSIRELRQQSLENDDPSEGDKSISLFDKPRDVEGTAFLSFTHILEPDDQWLYLPALKRVKRISSANKSGPFMGSEFAYEDLTSFEVDKFAYTWLRDEPCGKDNTMTCFVIHQVPKYENSGYTKRIVWIDRAEYRPIKIEFYDRKEELLKTLEYRDYKQYLDQYWRSSEMEVVNHQTGKSTVLEFEDYEFRTDIDEGDFSPRRLERLR